MTAVAEPDVLASALDRIVLPCEVGGKPPCEQPSEWVLRVSCVCGTVHPTLICTPHHNDLIGETAEQWHYICPKTRALMKPIPILSLDRI